MQTETGTVVPVETSERFWRAGWGNALLLGELLMTERDERPYSIISIDGKQVWITPLAGGEPIEISSDAIVNLYRPIPPDALPEVAPDIRARLLTFPPRDVDVEDDGLEDDDTRS